MCFEIFHTIRAVTIYTWHGLVGKGGGIYLYLASSLTSIEYWFIKTPSLTFNLTSYFAEPVSQNQCISNDILPPWGQRVVKKTCFKAEEDPKSKQILPTHSHTHIDQALLLQLLLIQRFSQSEPYSYCNYVCSQDHWSHLMTYYRLLLITSFFKLIRSLFPQIPIDSEGVHTSQLRPVKPWLQVQV